ncbi:MAG: metallophosphoesterase family protein [Verrucomicrobiales bacterium]
MKCLAACLLLPVFSSMSALASDLGTTAESMARPFMHHRVLFMHDPSTKASIAWTTADELFESHAVHWDTESRGGDPKAYANKTHRVRSHPYTIVAKDRENGVPMNIGHSVLLEDLEPATTYYFVVVSGDHVSREFHFVTAPDDGRPLKLLFGGDSRRPPQWPEVHEDRRKINRMIASLVEEHPDVVAFVHGGDYCAKAEWTFMTDWLSDLELATTESGRLLPLIPARGNHDRQIVFEEIFHWPDRDHDYYYATDLSEKVTLLTLNTEISHAGDQRDWLAKTLKRYREGEGERRWILVSYHVPSWGSVKDFAQGASQRQHWVPLFEDHQVDLVLESDHHSLKRTVPIYREKHDPEKGIVYIGDGGLGVPQRDPDPGRWYLQEPGMTTNGHHVHLLTITDEKIVGEAIGLDGTIMDRFEILP